MSDSRAPFGVFDSGVGGLTVLRALRTALPAEDFIYLGDTARLPYGTKSAGTVANYALQAAAFLHQQPLKALVIACNTATAHGLATVQAAYPDLLTLGVIAAGAAQAAHYRRVLVLATEGTVQTGAYTAAIHQHNPLCEVRSQAAGLLVALAEEGWTEGAEAKAILQRYLAPYRTDLPEAIVLGCTHFPLLAPLIAEVVGPEVVLIDSAKTTAAAAKALLAQRGQLRLDGSGQLQIFATDGLARFAGLAGRFLGEELRADQLALADARLNVVPEDA